MTRKYADNFPRINNRSRNCSYGRMLPRIVIIGQGIKLDLKKMKKGFTLERKSWNFYKPNQRRSLLANIDGVFEKIGIVEILDVQKKGKRYVLKLKLVEVACGKKGDEDEEK